MPNIESLYSGILKMSLLTCLICKFFFNFVIRRIFINKHHLFSLQKYSCLREINNIIIILLYFISRKSMWRSSWCYCYCHLTNCTYIWRMGLPDQTCWGSWTLSLLLFILYLSGLNVMEGIWWREYSLANKTTITSSMSLTYSSG